VICMLMRKTMAATVNGSRRIIGGGGAWGGINVSRHHVHLDLGLFYIYWPG
jgi:hypothetical protein